VWYAQRTTKAVKRDVNVRTAMLDYVCIRVLESFTQNIIKKLLLSIML